LAVAGHCGRSKGASLRAIDIQLDTALHYLDVLLAHTREDLTPFWMSLQMARMRVGPLERRTITVTSLRRSTGRKMINDSTGH